MLHGNVNAHFIFIIVVIVVVFYIKKMLHFTLIGFDFDGYVR